MPRKKKRRNRTAHAGVKLLARELAGGKLLHLARWRDPASGKAREASLEPLGLSTEEARRTWAVSKARDLARERAALAAGLPPSLGAPRTVEGAIEDYLSDCENRGLRPRTRAVYKDDLRAFVAFCEAEGIDRPDRLTSPCLERFRQSLTRERRKREARGGKRGEKKASGQARAAASVNRALRHVRAFVLAARRLGLAPRLEREAITEGFRKLAEPRPQPEILRPAELRALLAAALRHDGEKFRMTRAEHDGLKLAGTTARYEPIAPLVLAALLTGCRIGELFGLPWSAVLLEPEAGKGELKLTPDMTKTKTGRTVTLAESPSLVRLLAALKLRAGAGRYVFGGAEPLRRDRAEAARKRMVGTFGAPRFDWQGLRQTCAAFLACAPGIHGGGTGAGAWREALRLGHSPMVAQKHYVDLVQVAPEARTLEAAMGIEDLAERIVRAASGGTAKPAIVAAEA